jgi:putative glutamine amidotransferase
MVAPVIGLTTYREDAAWGVWHQRADLLPTQYAAAVEDTGGVPVLLPPVGSIGAADALVARLDGLVISGGADVEPARYGAEAHPRTVARPDRDAGELAVARAAIDIDLPVLGVCRGMEVLAVAYGGTLHQHLPDLLGHERHQPEPGVQGRHAAHFVAGSRAAKIFGATADVNSYHHQAINDPGRLTVTGWADDEVIEAVEDPSLRFLVGVQWHPEEQLDVRPFAALVEAA